MSHSLQQRISNTILSKKSSPALKQPTPFPSKSDWQAKFSGSTAPPVVKTYTGDKMLGIATMHKSNAVPVFSQQSAQEIGKMK